MTYEIVHSRATRRYGARRRRARGGLGDLFDFLNVGIPGFTSADELTDAIAGNCREDADVATQGMASEIDAFEKTWNPTGFYTPDQVVTVLETTLSYSDTAVKQMMEALRSVDIGASGKEASKREFDTSYEEFSAASDRRALFIDAVNKARKSGTRAIDAPGLKLWVIQVMRATHKLSRAASFIVCNVTAIESVVRSINAAADRAFAVIVKVGGIVLAAGEKAIGVAFDFAGLMLSLIKYAPYVLVAGGGFYLYKKYRER
jgi:hypothetical protein